MLLLTLRGTPTLYYGDEIGIADIDMSGTAVLDPAAINEPGVSFNRDRSRSPMQWSDEAAAGFSPAKPWLPLTSDHRTRNVAIQHDDTSSMLSLYRALLRLRAEEPDLQTGAYQRVAISEDVLAYRRGERIAVVLNLSEAAVPLDLPGNWLVGEVLLCATTGQPLGALPDTLAPGEGLVLRLKESAA
jgi:alpha-glucosidase